MSFNLMLPPILGVVGLAIAFVIYTVMSRASDGEAKNAVLPSRSISAPWSSCTVNTSCCWHSLQS